MVRMGKEIEHQIRYVGEKAFPDEGCGMILGVELDRVQIVREVIELQNSSPAHRDERFLITAQQYRQTEIAAKGRNLEVLGFFHSHPNHRPEPSAYDLEHALPSFVYIIVAVIGGVAGRMAAWTLSENRSRFDRTDIDIGS